MEEGSITMARDVITELPTNPEDSEVCSVCLSSPAEVLRVTEYGERQKLCLSCLAEGREFGF